MDYRIACAIASFACAAAQAAPVGVSMSKTEMTANKVRIEEQYDNAQARCRRVQGHARALCNEQARGERDVQAAELQMRAQPTPENDQKLRLAKAEAKYAISLIRCKDLEGQARKVCRSDAKRVHEDARTEARLQMEVVTQTMNAENTVRERTAVADRVNEAQFAAARDRCEMLPAEGRQNCLADARQRFGKL